MIEATKERMLKLADAWQEQGEKLPETSVFGDVNDLKGMLLTAEFAREVAEKLDDRVELRMWLKELEEEEEKIDRDDEILLNRNWQKQGVLNFALGIDDMDYRDMLFIDD